MINQQINNTQCLSVLKDWEGKALVNTVLMKEFTFLCVPVCVCTHVYVCMLLGGEGVSEQTISKYTNKYPTLDEVCTGRRNKRG